MRSEDPGPEHDAHLRSALRHAPDAALGPSAALDDAILRRARSATAETPEYATAQDALSPRDGAAPQGASVPPRPQREDPRPAPARQLSPIGRGIAGWWSWLARPSVASGFAGVLVATLVGVMWWGRPLDEAMPPRHEAPAAAAPSAEDRSTAVTGERGDDVRAAGTSNPTTSGVTLPDVSKPNEPVPTSPKPDSRPPDAPRRDASNAAVKPTAPTATAPTAPTATAPTAPTAPAPTARTAPAQMAKRQAEPSAFPAPDAASADLRKLERRGGEADRQRARTDAAKARMADTAPESAASTSPAAAPPGLSAAPRSVPRFEAKAPQANAPAPASPPAPAHADALPSSREAPPAAPPNDATIAQKSRALPERLALQERPPMAAAQAPATASAQRETPNRETSNREIAGAVEDRKADSSEVARRSVGSLAMSRAGPPARSPLAPLRTALVTEPDRWTWSGDGGRVQRVTPELLAWLARLDIALAARPVDSSGAASAPDSEDAVPSTTPGGPVRALVLLREGRRHTELRLGDALEVTPIDPPGPRWRLALAPDSAAALRDSMP